MKALPSNSNSTFRQPLLDLLWRQWSALGVAGSVVPETSGAIDIEALVLATTEQGRYDARLFDEMLDWLWTNAGWVNVQRLRNLNRDLSLGNTLILGAVADFLSKRAIHSKWKALARSQSPKVPTGKEPLFHHGEGRAQRAFGEPDPLFLRWGFWRGPYRLRNMSRAPSPLPASNLIYKLRGLFGVQARCEVLLWLLSNKGGRPSEIAKAAFYYPRTVEETLKELTASGLVREARSGRSRHYGLDLDEWAFLRTWNEPAGFPEWIDWPRRFVVAEKFFMILGREDLSETLLSSELRRVKDELQPVIADGKLLSAFAASRRHTGAQFTEALIRDLRLLLEN
jgi:DNA-binding transcriptional ArsR family regulator